MHQTQHGLFLLEHLPKSYYHDFTDGALHQDTSNCSCDTYPRVTTLFSFFPVCNLPLVPAWILAVVIGVVGGWRLQRLGPSMLGSFSYSITFFMYAAMITSGLFVHCLFLVECGAAPTTEAYISTALIDASLTSCIAFSFIFNGLVDLRITPERSVFTELLMGVTYLAIFLVYFSRLINPATLYKGSIVLGCSLYLLCQLDVLYKAHSMRLILCLSAAGFVGGTSFLLFSEGACLLCTEFGAWSIEGVWYYGSDIAMFFLLLYILATRQPTLMPHSHA